MFQERVVLENGFVINVRLSPGGRYGLSCHDPQNLVVEFKGDARTHRRMLRGRESAYGFKSVEQLRYDFERDAEDAQRQG